MSMKKQVKVPTVNQYDTVSPATKLLEKRRKMYEIHQAFEAEKQQFKKKQLDYAQEQEAIKSKDRKFQQDMTKFCQFSQENEIKKKKAQERLSQENKVLIDKEETIKNLEKEIEELTKSQKRYQNKVGYFRKYEEYLEKVRNTYNDQYPEMADILSRYQTLKKSNTDLIQSRLKMQAEHEALKKKSLIEQKQLNRSILTISNQTKLLFRKIEDKLKQKNEVQSQVESSNEEFSKKNLTLGKIFMAIDNLHFRCTENNFKLKHDFEQKQMEKKQFKATKKIEGQTNVSKNEDEVSFEQKSKIAAGKLKSIVEHMKLLKVIIDMYKSFKAQGEKA